MKCRHSIFLLIATMVLSSCSLAGQNQTGNANTQSSQTATQSQADRQAAEEKLAKMLDARRQQQTQQDEQQRSTDDKAAKAAADAAKPHYDAERLRMAINWRQWADITVPDFNIHAWLKSNWKDGTMHLRLALLGEKTALRIFSGSWKYLKIIFADQNGTNLHQATLATSDLHWADSLRNSGVPTMEFEGDSEVPLEVYEQIVQWNLKWQNELD